MRPFAKSGGTHVDTDMEGKSMNLMARVTGATMTPMMRRAMRKCIESDLRDVKRV